MASSPGAGRRWNIDRRISFGQLLIGVLGLLIAVSSLYFGWLQTRQAAGTTSPAPPVQGATSPPVATPSVAAATPQSGRATYLDSLAAEKGGGLLVGLPRDLEGAGYTHALAVECPSNSAGDQEREVSYALGRRYTRLDATVRPYYEIETDRQSVTHVTVLMGTRQRDGTISTRETGAQEAASMAAPRDLTADLRGGDILTIRFRCAAPTGVIVLTEVRLTPV